MTQFQDVHGVQWSVQRRWWNVDFLPNPALLGNDVVSLIIAVVCLVLWLPFALVWPIWFVAKFCGAPWKVVIRRNREEVYTERVRGWSKSEQRIDAIVQSLRKGVSQPPPAG